MKSPEQILAEWQSNSAYIHEDDALGAMNEYYKQTINSLLEEINGLRAFSEHEYSTGYCECKQDVLRIFNKHIFY